MHYLQKKLHWIALLLVPEYSRVSPGRSPVPQSIPDFKIGSVTEEQVAYSGEITIKFV